MSDNKKNGNTVIIIVFCLLFVCGVLGTIAFVMEMTKKKCATATPASEGYQTEKYSEISRSAKEKYTDKYEICPGNGKTNNSNITSAEECKQAKGDKTWGGVDTLENRPNYPKGCYINDDTVWFNPDENGSTDDNSRSICKKASPVSSAVNVPLMKMSNRKIDCSGKLCDLKPCLGENCVSISTEVRFLKEMWETENKSNIASTCIKNAADNKDTTPECRPILDKWNATAKNIQATGGIELNINKNIDKHFKQALNMFVIPKESFGKDLTPIDIQVGNYKDSDADGKRAQILFTKILLLSQKLEDLNSVQQNSESVTKEPKRLLNYDEYLKLISECYFGALRDADKLPTEKERKARKKGLKKNVDQIFNYLRKEGVMNKVGLNEELTTQLHKDIHMTLFGEVKSNFGYDYDSDGYQRRYNSCYLITALTKNKLLSIGQVHQLRKVMLETFKDESNHKFFHFYYSHFQGIADFLESTGRLNEIVPDMLEVVELSKRGEMQSAFEKYISVARKAYQMCKDMKLDVSGIEQKWDTLEDFKMTGLPEPNTLFVEEPFKKALRHFETVC